MIAGGQQIDIMYASIGGAYSNVVANGLQYDISELAKKHNVDLGRFEPETLEMIRHLGGLYGLPLNLGGMILYYNKEIFDRFGVDYPTDGMYWDDVLEISKRVGRVHDDGTRYNGLAASISHLMNMNPLSLDIVDRNTGKAGINTDLWKSLLQTIYLNPIMQNDVHKENILSANSLLTNTDYFQKHRTIAMFLAEMGSERNWISDEFKDFNWDAVSLPNFREAPGIGSQPYPAYFYITVSSKHKDEAMQVLDYATSEEVQMIESRKGVVTSLKSTEVKQAFGLDTPYQDKNVKYAVTFNRPAKPSNVSPNNNIVIKALESRLIQHIGGQFDINTLLREAEEEANIKIQEANQK